MAGELVGEAWVALHVRDGGVTPETRKIAQKAAEQYGAGLEDEIDKQVKQRFSGDKSVTARFLLNQDEESIDAAIARWGDRESIRKAMQKIVDQVGDTKIFMQLNRQLNQSMDLIDKRLNERAAASAQALLDAQNKAFASYGRNINVTQQREELERLNSTYGQMRLELEKLARTRENLRDSSVLKAMESGDWKPFLRTIRETDDAHEELGQSLIRLSNQYEDFRVNQLEETIESFRRFRDEQERVAQEKGFSAYAAKLSRDFEKAQLALDDYASTAEKAQRRVNQALDTKIAVAEMTGDWEKLSSEMDNSRVISGRVKERLDELSRSGKIHVDTVREINLSYNRWRRASITLGQAFDDFPEKIGRMFGRGSRNNFLNFFGSVLKNFSDLALAIPRLGGKIASGIGDVISDFMALKGAGVGVGTALTRSLAPAFAALIPALAAFAVGAALVVKLLPAIAAAISTLTGILTAWVGVLVNGVLGALVPLAPLLLAVGGGFIALGVAFGKTAAEMKKIKDEGGRLTREMRLIDDGISQMSKSMDRFATLVMPEAARTFGIMSDAVSGFIDAIGPGVERGMKRFNNIISGPSMDPFLDLWQRSLPRMFEDFAAGLGQLGAGLTKFFTPILPYAERLSRAFYDMMFNFNVWAGSAEGQNKIAEWMDRAWRAADALWGTLGNLVSILGQLFNIGTDEAGLSWLEGLEEMTRGWNEALKDPEGREAVSQWFRDAKDVGGTLWEILKDIGSFFDELDTGQARTELDNFLGTVETVTSGLEDVAEAITITSGLLSQFFGGSYKPSGNDPIDMGVYLGLTPESAEEVVDEFSNSLDGKLMKLVLPPNVYDFIDGLSEGLDAAIAAELDGTAEGSFLGLDEWFNRLTERTRNKIGAWLQDSAAEDGLDSGVLLGLKEEKSFLGLDEWFNRLTDRTRNNIGTWLEDVTGEEALDTGALLGLEDRSFLGLDEWFNRLAERTRTNIENWRLGFEESGDTGLDAGALLGLGSDQDSFLGLDEWFLRLTERTREGIVQWGIDFNEDLKKEIAEAFGVDGETWADIGTNIWDGFVQGLQDGWDERVVQPFQDFVDDVREFFGIASPSTLFFDFGNDVVNGFINGIIETFTQMPGVLAERLGAMATQVQEWAMALPGKVYTWLAGLGGQMLARFNEAAAQVGTWMATQVGVLGAWFSSLPGKVYTWLATLGTNMLTNFETAKAKLSVWMTETGNNLRTWMTSLPGKAYTWLSGIGERMAAPFSDAWTRMNDALASIWRMVSGWWDRISGIVGLIKTAAASQGGAVGGLSRFAAQFMASGGLVNGPTLAMIGEAGREAVVPLDRPLSQVDPAVRGLAAIAQGKASGGVTVESGAIVLQYAGQDPYRAAEVVLDNLAQSLA